MEGDGANSETFLKRFLLVLNCLMLGIGTTGAPLLMRLYYIHGGKRVWLMSWLQMAAFPMIIVPLAISYIRRRRRWAERGSSGHPPRPILMKSILFVGAAIVGLLTGVDNYMYAYGGARLPVSTSSLIIASQLGFTAFFGFLLVKLRSRY